MTPDYRPYTAWLLALTILRHPFYQILICADEALPPSPWSDEMYIECDRIHKVIRVRCDLI